MNLFLLAWNLPDDKVPFVLSEIHNMRAVYQLLDPNTIWSFGQGTRVFAASMHTANNAAAPRIYVKRSENQVVLYEGCLVDRTGSFHAHDAEALSLHWNDLPSALEGQFVTVRVSKNPPSIEIVNDALGMCQVYYLRLDNTWLISNSAGLLRRISNVSEFDPLGVSLFLCWGWAGSDRTLRRGIRVIPGGQHWKWEEGFTEPKRVTYFDRAQLSRKTKGKLAKADVEQLAGELIQTCKNLAQSFGPLECPITAGRDSRLMASLLIRGEIEAQYFTRGIRENIDVQIGTQIARHFNLPHRIRWGGAENDAVIEGWEDASRRLVQQNDGMVSLTHVGEQPLQLERLGVELSGAGGEIARGYYNSARFFWGGHGVDYTQQYLAKRLMGKRKELFHQETVAMVQKYLQDFVQQVVDEGFPPIDVPDIFYTYERVRRWAGINISATQNEDVFVPLCMRPFIETAFSIPAQRRYSEPVHYQLLYYLVPELHRFPFEKNWRPQQPIINLVYGFLSQKLGRRIGMPMKHIVTSQTETGRRLEVKRSQIRELCLDQSDSFLWNFIDRSKFKRITSSDTNPSERQRLQQVLWDVVTLFQYAQLCEPAPAAALGYRSRNRG